MSGRFVRVGNRSLLPGRFPPIAVKLNGETARTKPSRARYSVRLWVDDQLGAVVSRKSNALP